METSVSFDHHWSFICLLTALMVVQCSWNCCDGKLWAGYEQVAVLHHLLKASSPRRQVHYLWQVRVHLFTSGLALFRAALFFTLSLFLGIELLIFNPFRVIDDADGALDAMEREPVTKKNRPIKDIVLTHVSLRSALSFPHSMIHHSRTSDRSTRTDISELI